MLGIRAALPLLLACSVGGGCNAILGTEEADPWIAAGGDPDGSTASSPDGSKGTLDSAGGGSGNTRDDATSPCDPCSVELVVDTMRSPLNVRVSGGYVYWSDGNGAVHRVARSNIPCQKEDCVETLLDESGTSDVSVAVSDRLVCWIGVAAYGCADPATPTKKTEIASSSFSFVGTRMLIQDGLLYFARGAPGKDVPLTLVSGDAAGLAAKTAGLVNVSEPNVLVHAFTVSRSHVAWTEANKVVVLKVKSLGGGAPVTISLPRSLLSNLNYIRDLALFDRYVYVSPYDGQHVYRAPIDGSEEATPLFEIDASGVVAVKPSGIYVGFAKGLRWTNLAGDVDKTLASIEGEIGAIDVADDGIYYAESNWSGPSKINRIKFR